MISTDQAFRYTGRLNCGGERGQALRTQLGITEDFAAMLRSHLPSN
ncbi:hypothetical protein AB0E59_42205 [Lentzea sp. NPDC034063]